VKRLIPIAILLSLAVAAFCLSARQEAGAADAVSREEIRAAFDERDQAIFILSEAVSQLQVSKLKTLAQTLPNAEERKALDARRTPPARKP
jgi:hypothetical protein